MNWTLIDYDDEATLPEPEDRVLIVLSLQNGHRCVSEGWLDKSGETRWRTPDTDRDGDFIEFYGSEVTHWQPFPPLPSENHSHE